MAARARTARHGARFKDTTAVAGPGTQVVASAAPWGTGPTSEMISRWQDQTSRSCQRRAARHPAQ